MRSPHYLAIPLLLVAALAAAAPADDTPVIASGKQTVETVKQLYKLCPSALSTITAYAGANGAPRWTSVAPFLGRYVLTIQFDIQLDDDGNKIVSSSAPSFELDEIMAVSLDADKQVAGSEQAKVLAFGPKEWQTLVSHNGDWSSLGLKLNKNQPVPNLDKYLQSAVAGAAGAAPAASP